MKRLAIKPSGKQLWLWSFPVGLSLVWALLRYFLEISEGAAYYSIVENGFYLLFCALFSLLSYDYWRARNVSEIKIERICPATVPVNRWISVTLHLTHSLEKAAHIVLRENYSAVTVSDPLDQEIELVPGQASEIKYRMKAQHRGDLNIHGADVCLPSILGFWQITVATQETTTLKVFPDFKAIAGYNLLATDNHQSQMGIRLKPRRGEGMDFHQLREYREGDTRRQIDWKASIKKHKLISKEYQDERDQQIVIMMDGGRRMRAYDDGLGQFDHSINAAVLLSYVALRQGDAVGVMSFAGNTRWLPGKKGSGNINAILNHVYDLQPTLSASDYSSAAQVLIQKQRKRSLIILITNTRDEDVDDLLPAVKLLRKHHLVLLANLREPSVEKVMQQPIHNEANAYRYAGTVEYIERRRKTQLKFQQQGVYVIDVLPDELPIEIINAYHGIKRSGAL